MHDAVALVHALPDPVILLGSDGRIRALSVQAKIVLGADLTGQPLVTALRTPAILDAVAACQSDGSVQTVHYTGNDGARDTFWDVTVSPVALTQVPAVVLSFRDTTAQSDADDKRRDFVANVSHELRTPLTSLMGFIDTLRGPAKNDPAAQARFLDIMEQEAGRMHRLVEDLLSLSRVEDLERIRPTGKVNLRQLVHEVLAGLDPVAEHQNVRLAAKVADTDVEVLGDRDQLSQVLRNLVENAVKYGGPDRTVTVQLLQTDQGEARLSVTDQGEGIAARHIARLTERFYRVDSHRNHSIGGTGLGLAICKHIITRHRARLQVTSEIGHGSVFTVIFPAASA